MFLNIVFDIFTCDVLYMCVNLIVAYIWDTSCFFLKPGVTYNFAIPFCNCLSVELEEVSSHILFRRTKHFAVHVLYITLDWFLVFCPPNLLDSVNWSAHSSEFKSTSTFWGQLLTWCKMPFVEYQLVIYTILGLLCMWFCWVGAYKLHREWSISYHTVPSWAASLSLSPEAYYFSFFSPLHQKVASSLL